MEGGAALNIANEVSEYLTIGVLLSWQMIYLDIAYETVHTSRISFHYFDFSFVFTLLTLTLLNNIQYSIFVPYTIFDHSNHND